MWKFNRTRPWLRYMEGTDGSQAGGNGTNAPAGSTSDEVGAGDASKSAGGDQGSSDRGNADDAAARIAAAVQKQAAASEPASGKKEAQADEPSMAQLMEMLQEQQKTIAALQESSASAAAEKRAEMASEVAKAAKLPESMASRLTGETREQLEADARELAKSLGSLVIDPAQGQGGGKVPALTLDQAVSAKIAAAGIK